MWADWIAGAQRQQPQEGFLAVQFGSGDGFFALGEARRLSFREDWSGVSAAVPIVGGVSFLGRAWGAWSDEEFFQPKVFVVRESQGTNVVLNELDLQPTDVNGDSERTILCRKEEAAPPTDRAAWEQLCAEIDAGISQGKWTKIVPMRVERRDIIGDASMDLARLWLRLSADSPDGSHRFLWRRGEEVFLGASPELLFSMDNGRARSQAVAGTAEKGSEADLRSEKNEHEHRVVVDYILARLTEFADKATVGDTSVVQCGSISHLYTPIEADLLSGPSHEATRSALQSLHPTPAVGGLPAQKACEFLGEREPWERGYFASPIGVSFAGRAKFLVAIRSAKISRRHVDFFAGAGYVAGSTAGGEWHETRLKMRLMQDILGGTQ